MLPLFTHSKQPQVGGRHRRRPGGCKKALDDQHVWNEQRYNYQEGALDEPLGYILKTCRLCNKKVYEWL